MSKPSGNNFILAKLLESLEELDIKVSPKHDFLSQLSVKVKKCPCLVANISKSAANRSFSFQYDVGNSLAVLKNPDSSLTFDDKKSKREKSGKIA